MNNEQQVRPATPDEDIRVLYRRVAKLNDRVSALLDPAWGAKARLLPTDHPLHPGDTAAEQGAPTDWQAVARQREQELKTVGEARHQAEQERDGAYRERARLVALIAGGLAEQVVVAPAPDVDEPGWQVLYATLHGCQCSWHFAPNDADLIEYFEHVPADDPRAQWDGHTTEAKYNHIDYLARGLGILGPFGGTRKESRA